MNIKSPFNKGDAVEIIDGKYKGQKGKFVKVYVRKSFGRDERHSNLVVRLVLAEAKVLLDDGRIVVPQHKFLKAYKPAKVAKVVQPVACENSVEYYKEKYEGKSVVFDTNVIAHGDTGVAGLVTLVYENRGIVWANVVFMGENDVIRASSIRCRRQRAKTV